MRLDRAWIEAHIPHKGRHVSAGRGRRVGCGAHQLPRQRSSRGRTPAASHGRLGIACGIEFAAQAMAVHGALVGDALEPREGPVSKPLAGNLASVRGVRLHVARLDDVQSVLICDARRIAGDRGSILYEFELRSATTPLLSGRAAVFDSAFRRDT